MQVHTAYRPAVCAKAKPEATKFLESQSKHHKYGIFQYFSPVTEALLSTDESYSLLLFDHSG